MQNDVKNTGWGTNLRPLASGRFPHVPPGRQLSLGDVQLERVRGCSGVQGSGFRVQGAGFRVEG